jgi:hypothetical protein
MESIVKELAPHQQRVVEEKDALSIKLNKLEAFVGSRVYLKQLSAEEQTRLSRQLLIMQLYEQVLEERIGAF